MFLEALHMKKKLKNFKTNFKLIKILNLKQCYHTKIVDQNKVNKIEKKIMLIYNYIMWRIVGLPWPSSRMSIFKIDHNLLKKKQILVAINKQKKKEKYKDYDKELGVEFPSSRFN